jgi:predicted dehydrogenase
MGFWYTDWRAAISVYPDADAAIIASPTEYHAEQLAELIGIIGSIPTYVEKPLMTIEQYNQSGSPPSFVDSLEAMQEIAPCVATGYQYRFHPVYRKAAPAIRRNGYVRFAANENLLDRYGPDCLSIIAAHPIDAALWLLGPAAEVHMDTDGLSVEGVIKHEHGTSEHRYRIDTGPRVSLVKSGSDIWSLDANNDMYLDAMRAWLAWVDGGPRDGRTATLSDGLEAMRVMAQVKEKERHANLHA